MSDRGEYRADCSRESHVLRICRRPRLSAAVGISRTARAQSASGVATGIERWKRTLHDLGDPISARPRDVLVTYSQHYCCKCKSYFNVDMSDLALPKKPLHPPCRGDAVRLVVEDGLPYRAASWHLWRDHRGFVPYATIQNWVECGGGKRRSNASAAITWTPRWITSRGTSRPTSCNDGPFCVLSIVDNRTFRRLIYEVLDHDPDHTDIERFFRAFQAAFQRRKLVLHGITTDGSKSLSPSPLLRCLATFPSTLRVPTSSRN